MARTTAPKKQPSRVAQSLDGLARAYGDVQLATLVEEPPAGAGWTFELKYDGYRIVGIESGSQARLMSRNGKEWSQEFPAITEAVRGMRADSCVVDGEVCALTSAGAPSFQLLQNRRSTTHLMYFVFDCLMLDGVDLRSSPIEERRTTAARLLDGRLLAPSCTMSGDPKALLELACRQGFEGLVAKAVGSRYVPGRSWLKAKCTLRQEFAIS